MSACVKSSRTPSRERAILIVVADRSMKDGLAAGVLPVRLERKRLDLSDTCGHGPGDEGMIPTAMRATTDTLPTATVIGTSNTHSMQTVNNSPRHQE